MVDMTAANRVVSGQNLLGKRVDYPVVLYCRSTFARITSAVCRRNGAEPFNPFIYGVELRVVLLPSKLRRKWLMLKKLSFGIS